MKKITEKYLQLGDLPSQIRRGSSSGSDDIFLLRREGESLVTRQGDSIDIETDILRVPIHAKNFGRYYFSSKSEGVIIFPYDVTANGYELKPEYKMKQDFPKAYRYLVQKEKTRLANNSKIGMGLVLQETSMFTTRLIFLCLYWPTEDCTAICLKRKKSSA